MNPDLADTYVGRVTLKNYLIETETLKYNDVSGSLEKLWGNMKPIVEKDFGQEGWEKCVRSTADELGWKHGDLFMLLRLAVIGSRFSPPLRESMELMGVEKCDRFVRDAIKFLEK